MPNNLDISLREFKRMRSPDRDILMYNNLVEIRKRIEDYRHHKKMQYVWLVVLTIFVGLKKFIGI